MKTADFDFDLPDSHIALRPAEPRDSARLLVVKDGTLEDRIVRDLPDCLRPGDALVFNDTRVIPARLSGVRERTGAEGETLTVTGEATLHHRDAPEVWSAFMKPGKRLKAGDRVTFQGLTATVTAKAEDGLVTLRFDLAGGVAGASRQVLDLARHDGEPATQFPGACGFDRRIQREQSRLARDVVDELHHTGDLR